MWKCICNAACVANQTECEAFSPPSPPEYDKSTHMIRQRWFLYKILEQFMLSNFVTPNNILLYLKEEFVCYLPLWFSCWFPELTSCFILSVTITFPCWYFINEITSNSLPVFVQNVQMFICTLMWMSPAVVLYIPLHHFIRWENATLLLLNRSNLASVIRRQ